MVRLIAWLTLAACLVTLAGPAWSEERIIYCYRHPDANNSVIYTAPADGSEPGQPLFQDLGADAHAVRVSPDGKKLAFINRNTKSILVSDIDGNNLLDLKQTVRAASLAWSSDSKFVIFWQFYDPENRNFDDIWRLGAFYRIAAVGGETRSLLYGQKFWSWYNDGGFDVYGVFNEESGELIKDYLIFGGTWTGQRTTCEVLRYPVQEEAFEFPLVLYFGEFDVFTPARGPVDGRMLVQLDDSGRRQIYLIQRDNSLVVMSDFYAGNPRWNRDQSKYAYILADDSEPKETQKAYRGELWIRSVDPTVAPIKITNDVGTAASPDFYYTEDEETGGEGEDQPAEE